MSYTLSLELAPDANTAGDTVRASVDLIVNGTPTSLGNITSLTATLGGVYRWKTFTFDVTSLFDPAYSDVRVRVRWVGGRDTVHLRRVRITDGSTTWHDQYGLLWWGFGGPVSFTNVGYGCDPAYVAPRCGPVPASPLSESGFALTTGPNGAFHQILPALDPCPPASGGWHLGLVW